MAIRVGIEGHPSIDHFSGCSQALVHMLPKPGEHARPFLASQEMRSPDELLLQADLLYRVHWAVRDAALKRLPIPNGLSPYVTHHRLHAINWMIHSHVPWDEVDVST